MFCRYCGRLLRTPKSIEEGIGPTCKKKKEKNKKIISGTTQTYLD